MRTEIDNWKRVVVSVSVARNGSPKLFIDGCNPMMLRLSRFVTPKSFRSASQFCQRAYQSRVRAFFCLITRHFSVSKGKPTVMEQVEAAKPGLDLSLSQPIKVSRYKDW